MKDISVLKGSTILITGATGIIGQSLVSRLLALDCKIYIITRNGENAKKLFADRVKIIECDVKDLKPCNLGIEYIIHCAANTSSTAFVEEPVNVISDNFIGTSRVLDFARENPIKSFVYLSTMEVYGYPSTEEKIDENHTISLDSMSVRSSYPESKRLCECLCASYLKQFNVPAKVVRLTQTFGPGVKYNDKRIFAEFSRCVIDKRDIVLHTDGSTKRSYLYVDDAVNAILIVLAFGDTGQAYNAANENTYCSILEMARLVADECAKGEIAVVIRSEGNINSYGYAPKLYMNLSTEKIRKLGWEPYVDLKEMFDRTIDGMKKEKRA